MFEFIETKRHTVESVYGKPEAKVLAILEEFGRVADGFRFAVDSDEYLSVDGNFPVRMPGLMPTDGKPRLILRRKTVKRRVLTETGEVRRAHSGEMYDYYGVVMRASITTSETYPIYCESFVEVEL